MSCLVTDADTVVLEWRRRERIVRALRVRATTRLSYCAEVPAYVRRDARQGLLAAPAIVDVESADPLGVWSSGAPRRPRRRPEWRAVADWAAWSVLCLLAIAYLAAR